jgi:hypothetical protein
MTSGGSERVATGFTMSRTRTGGGYDARVNARAVRSFAAVAVLVAALVVIGHLVVAWNGEPDPLERREIAFWHGAGLAALLVAALVAGRLALWLEGRTTSAVADAIGVAGTIAVLGHMARVWVDAGLLDTLPTVAAHLAALAGILALSLAVRGKDPGAREPAARTPARADDAAMR